MAPSTTPMSLLSMMAVWGLCEGGKGCSDRKELPAHGQVAREPRSARPFATARLCYSVHVVIDAVSMRFQEAALTESQVTANPLDAQERGSCRYCIWLLHTTKVGLLHCREHKTRHRNTLKLETKLCTLRRQPEWGRQPFTVPHKSSRNTASAR